MNVGREYFPGFLVLKVNGKCLFSQNYMAKILFFSLIFLTGCFSKQAYPPVGGILSEKDMQNSQTRAKNLNELERKQIQDWIDQQDDKFYPMGMNYWVSIENLEQNEKKQDGTEVSYQYEIYDFDKVKLYEKPVVKQNALLGKFEEIDAVENAVCYLNTDNEVTLLVPSILAFGTYGDNDKIPNDMPLIIKLKMLKN